MEIIERRRLIFGLRPSIEEVANSETLVDRARGLRERLNVYEGYVQRGMSTLDERLWQESLATSFEAWLSDFKALGGS